MKVYFEIDGVMPVDDKSHYTAMCYVKPDKEGGGYRYTFDEKLYNFSWCDASSAKCIDSSELPKDMWYSIRHGVFNFILPEEEREDIRVGLSNKDINISKLKYEKVDPKQVKMYKKAKKAAEYINSIEELKEFYPKIEGLVRIPTEFVRKVFKLSKALPTKVVNGELGLAQFNDSLKYTYIINHLIKKQK